MAHPIDRTEEILDWERKWKESYEPDTTALETTLSLKYDGPGRKPYTLTVKTKVPMDNGAHGLEEDPPCI